MALHLDPRAHVHTGELRQTAIDRSISVAEAASNGILTRVMELQDLLCPVLMPPSGPGSSGKEPQPLGPIVVPPLAGRIDATADRMLVVSGILDDIMARLEL